MSNTTKRVSKLVSHIGDAEGKKGPLPSVVAGSISFLHPGSNIEDL